MSDFISPKYQMKLIKDISRALWAQYETDRDILFYINKWHFLTDEWNGFGENFRIVIKENKHIDLEATLHNIDSDTLIKIAIDLGVETPDFIPSIPTFRNEIKSDYSSASATFEKAFKQIETDPDTAIGLANSALESIIKEILQDNRLNSKVKGKETLYDLTTIILKEFQLYPNSTLTTEIKTLGSSLLAINQSIEKLRSEKTHFHGKTQDEYVITDSMYTYLVVNSVTTVGLFLNSYYKKRFPPPTVAQESADDLPF